MRKLLLLSMGFAACAWFSSCSNDIENSVVSYCIETDGSHFVSAEQAKSNAIAFLNDFNRGKETRTVSPSVEVEDVVAYRSNDVSDSETRSGSSDGIVFYAVNRMSGSYYHCNWGLFGNLNGYYCPRGSVTTNICWHTWP